MAAIGQDALRVLSAISRLPIERQSDDPDRKCVTQYLYSLKRSVIAVATPLVLSSSTDTLIVGQ